MKTGFINKAKQLFARKSSAASGTTFKMVRESGTSFYAWNGKLYESDIVRACIRPKVKAVGKMMPKHIRQGRDGEGKPTIQVNPDAHMRFLLEEPNPFMTFQLFVEKMEGQLVLNNNAFALIVRDGNGYPMQLLPIVAITAQAKLVSEALYLTFNLMNGNELTAPYSDIIHLRNDFLNDDIFGEPLAPVLAPLMEVVSTTDQGIISAIKNSSVIQWLLKFGNAIRPEDLKRQAKEFADNYLQLNNDSIGVAATDSKAEAIRIEPKDYVPNAAQQDRTTDRIMALLNTNKKIITSSYSEDDWIAYYEAEIERDGKQWSEEMTRKLFSRKERGFGDKIYFEAANLQYASMRTKLALYQMVDRRSMTPNEWRAVLNIAPSPEGDEMLQRKDTGTVGDAGVIEEVSSEDN